MTPPIPVHLAGRPTHGGLVVPWVSVILADGTPVLGNMHGARVDQALFYRLCQICGLPIRPRPIVLFASETSHANGQTSEPGMHPECAAYAAKACPMVNGRMQHWQASGRVHGQSCPVPGCNCDGWVDEPGGPTAGRPSEPWYAIWVRDYDLGIDPTTRRPNAAIYARHCPLKIRPITPERCPA